MGLFKAAAAFSTARCWSSLGAAKITHSLLLGFIKKKKSVARSTALAEAILTASDTSK